MTIKKDTYVGDLRIWSKKLREGDVVTTFLPLSSLLRSATGDDRRPCTYKVEGDGTVVFIRPEFYIDPEHTRRYDEKRDTWTILNETTSVTVLQADEVKDLPVLNVVTKKGRSLVIKVLNNR
jgi:hypothetical protein